MFEAIVLAGGLGTRLRNILGKYPKPMADINGKPFLWYLLRFLSSEKVKRAIIAVGFKKEIIIDYFGKKFHDIDLVYSLEDSPLGTGGALREALKLSRDRDVFVINGDTLFCVNLQELRDYHLEKRADITIALKYLKKVDRYGLVEMNENGRIKGFIEKGGKSGGYINGGVYMINTSRICEILSNIHEKNFSFERDIIESRLESMSVFGREFDSYFIDIGIKEDYERAKVEFNSMICY